jgi:acetyl-CoA carboxylase carboxyltransferase component
MPGCPLDHRAGMSVAEPETAVERSDGADNRAVAALSAFIDAGTFQPWRSAVGDGVLAGTAYVGGRPVCVWTQDPAHVGGSLGCAGGETIAHTIGKASRAGVPVIALPHSAGARLQEGAAALSAYAAIFRAQALARVPQITLIPGFCAGGAAYSPALGDFVVMVGPQARLFLTGPKVVAQVMREHVSGEDLGGPPIHAANGVAHLLASDEPAAAALLRELLAFLPTAIGAALPVAETEDAPAGDPSEHLPGSTRQVYDVRHVIANVCDGGHHLELSGRWARNMVTTLARLGGHPVGVLANQPRYLGGTIDTGASEKATWFVELCHRLRLPLVVFVDTPGFLPGTKQERAGIIRHGSGLLRAFARATTPKLTVTLRQAFGGAHIVMNSRDLGADLTLAWPDAKIGVMGADQAVRLVERRAIDAGGDIDELAGRYAQANLEVTVAAAKGLVDEVIAPCETRDRLIRALALHACGRTPPERDDAVDD